MDVREKIPKFVFLGASFLSAGITLAILGFMVVLAYPIFAKGMFWNMLIQPWSPDQGLFGLGPMIAGTLAIASLAVCISFPISCGVACFSGILHPGGKPLTDGGVSVFVVIFTIYPIAAVLFKEADLPKRLIVAAIALGAGTFSMTALPGTPAIQNLIPAQVLGTPATAAPVLGIVASIIMFALGFWYLSWQSKVAERNEEHFVPGPNDDMSKMSLVDPSLLPDWKLAFLPLVCVIGLIVILRNLNPIYAVTIALATGTSLTYILFWKRIENPLKTLNDGVSQSVMALLNTAAIVGFGFVVKGVVAFKSFVDFAFGLPFPPLVSAACAVNIMAGITGSASGGLTIFMKTMGPQYMEMGLAPDVLHRICSVASGGLDSLPHSGAVITLLMVMGVTHREGYKDLGVVTVAFPIVATIVIILLAMLGVH